MVKNLIIIILLLLVVGLYFVPSVTKIVMQKTGKAIFTKTKQTLGEKDIIHTLNQTDNLTEVPQYTSLD